MIFRRSLRVAAGLLIVASLTNSPLFAQETRFSGSAEGCFGWDCSPVGESLTGEDVLHFQGLSFDGWTVGQSLDLSFGYFWWEDFTGLQLLGTPFRLALDFTSPEGTGLNAVFDGLLAGVVYMDGSLPLDRSFSLTGLHFVPNQKTFTFTGGESGAGGTFSLALNDVYIEADGRSYLTGRIETATVTPEPFTIALLGTGLVGIGGAAARRRRRGSADASTVV